MNMTLNEKYLKARLRRAGWMQGAGIVLVILSFVASLFLGAEVWIVLLSYPALIIGFPLWQYGRGQVRYWRAMQQVAPALLEEVRPGPKQHLFAFVPVNGTMIDALLVSAEGLLVIEIKGATEGLVATGPGGASEYKTGGFAITCKETAKGDRWSQRLPILERLARLGEPALGNPTQTVQQKVAKVKEWLAAQRGSRGEVPVRGLVVFRNPKTPLDIESSSVEVIHLNELRSFLGLGQYFEEQMRPVVSVEDRNRITAALRDLLGPDGAKPMAPAAAGTKAPVRKLSPEARAEQERVKAIRAERAAQAAAQAAPARKPAPRRGSSPAAPASVGAKPGPPAKPAGPRKGS